MGQSAAGSLESATARDPAMAHAVVQSHSISINLTKNPVVSFHPFLGGCSAVKPRTFVLCDIIEITELVRLTYKQ